MRTKIEQALKAKYGEDVELRQGERSFLKEYSAREIAFGGIYVLAIDDEDIAAQKNKVGRHGAYVLSFVVADESWEALVGGAAAAKAEAEAKAKTEAEAKAKAKEAAEIAARKARKEPEAFEFRGCIRRSARGNMRYLEAPAGTFVVGDRVTVCEMPPRPGIEVVVTGLGKDFRSFEGELVHRAYVMRATEYDALSAAERKMLPKSPEEALRRRTEDTRKAAKVIGGKALKGTPRQKAWAEDIRKQTLCRVSEEVASRLLSEARFQRAKWWIENRSTLINGDVSRVI